MLQFINIEIQTFYETVNVQCSMFMIRYSPFSALFEFSAIRSIYFDQTGCSVGGRRSTYSKGILNGIPGQNFIYFLFDFFGGNALRGLDIDCSQ